ncbi:hypothetical protein NEFER03_0264 [Nematocida sp. LUAm3]|nr:hypothetical protein NEFER03_0264 [Nematocida sp. LUAm3]KAI5173717.1 hypothetical protein NEFER02_0233 [Nematocida sp. LUAm2]KAI5176939.1 hypothetical protein NEFER01_0264 [Nematocida sp. LUAm1]
MKVFEGQAKKDRVLIGVNKRYVCLVSFHWFIDMSRIISAEHTNSSITIRTDSESIVVDDLNLEDITEVYKAISSKRMLRRDEIKESIKKDTQLAHYYQNITEEEESLFYKTFGERIINSSSKQTVDLLESNSSRKKALFILSNPLLIRIFFQMNMPFQEFVKEAFSGAILLNQEENEVDKAIFLHLKQENTCIGRLNAFSFISQSTWEEDSPVKKEEITAAPPKKSEFINPNLFTGLSKDSSSHIKHTLAFPKDLSSPEISVQRVDTPKSIDIPLSLLKRIRETSRLIYKNRENKENIKDLEKAAKHLEHIFREESRRRFSEEDGEIAVRLVSRILPSRFLQRN